MEDTSKLINYKISNSAESQSISADYLYRTHGFYEKRICNFHSLISNLEVLKETFRENVVCLGTSQKKYIASKNRIDRFISLVHYLKIHEKLMVSITFSRRLYDQGHEENN